jgi:hypothetical protein
MVRVSPGKDVTLYIPAETPPEVIDYMNRLKEEGNFSHGVIDILTKHILQELAMAPPHVMEETFTVKDAFITEPKEDNKYIDSNAPGGQPSFSRDELFRQASRNAGKLMQETADNANSGDAKGGTSSGSGEM